MTLPNHLVRGLGRSIFIAQILRQNLSAPTPKRLLKDGKELDHEKGSNVFISEVPCVSPAVPPQ